MYQTIYGTQVIKLRILNCHFKVLEIFFWHIGIKKVMKSDVWLVLLCAKVDIWSTFFFLMKLILSMMLTRGDPTQSKMGPKNTV